MLATIQFERYYLSNINFEYNPASSEEEEKNVRFKHDIEYIDDQRVKVSINCLLSDRSGLFLDVTITGFFKANIKNQDIEKEKLSELFENNTLAILFPYLRSSISDISLKANIEPIILPTINILGLIEQSKVEKDDN